MLTGRDGTLMWYFARASGIVAWLLLLGSVLWGLLVMTRPWPRPRRPWANDIHRFLGGTALVFIALHVVTLALDSYAAVGVVDVLVPFHSRWRTAGVAWGVIALYLAIAVQVSSWAMRALPRRLWRGIHLTSVPLLGFATAHTVATGTDMPNVLLEVALACGATVAAYLIAHRVLSAGGQRLAGR